MGTPRPCSSHRVQGRDGEETMVLVSKLSGLCSRPLQARREVKGSEGPLGIENEAKTEAEREEMRKERGKEGKEKKIISGRTFQ